MSAEEDISKSVNELALEWEVDSETDIVSDFTTEEIPIAIERGVGTEPLSAYKKLHENSGGFWQFMSSSKSVISVETDRTRESLALSKDTFLSREIQSSSSGSIGSHSSTNGSVFNVSTDGSDDDSRQELAQSCEPIYEKRRQIVSGDYEPIDSDLSQEDEVPAVAQTPGTVESIASMDSILCPTIRSAVSTPEHKIRRSEDTHRRRSPGDIEYKKTSESEDKSSLISNAISSSCKTFSWSSTDSASDITTDEMPIAIERRVSALKKLFVDMVLMVQTYGTSCQELAKSIPDFWLNVLMATVFEEMIEEYDEPILQHLIDIKETMNKEKKEHIIEFHFSANEYFENEVLTKKLLILTDTEEECQANCQCRPIKCESTPIEWKNRKNSALFDPISGQLKPSFFQFFWSSGEPLDETQEKRLIDDWKLFKKLSNDWIPRAVFYYTGEAAVFNKMIEESVANHNLNDHNDDEDDDESQEESDEPQEAHN